MPGLTQEQRRRRERAEAVIRVMAPALDLVLVAGERLSRLVEHSDDDYYPPQRASVPPPPAERHGTSEPA